MILRTRRWFFRDSRSEQVAERSRVKRLLTTTLRSCKMFIYNDAHRVSIHDNLNMPRSEAQCCSSVRRLLAQACASRVGDLVFYFSLPSAGQCPQKAGIVFCEPHLRVKHCIDCMFELHLLTCAPGAAFKKYCSNTPLEDATKLLMFLHFHFALLHVAPMLGCGHDIMSF